MKGGQAQETTNYRDGSLVCDQAHLFIIPPTCSMLIAQGTFSMLVMVEMADQTALWCARGQRMMATRVRTFIYFTAKEKK